MQDAYYNANQALDSQSRDQQFGLALAGLQEDVAQDQFNANISTINSMMAPMKNALKGLGSQITGANGLMPSSPRTAPALASPAAARASPAAARASPVAAMPQLTAPTGFPSPTDGQRNITTFANGRAITTTVPAGANLQAYRQQHAAQVAAAKAPPARVTQPIGSSANRALAAQQYSRQMTGRSR